MDQVTFFRRFHPLTNEDYALLQPAIRERGWGKGDALLLPGQVQRELYFIRQGIQMVCLPADQNSQVLAFTYPPNVLALPDAFGAQQPSKYQVICLTPTTAGCISFGDLQALFDESQGIERLFRKMTERVMAGVLDQYVELRTTHIAERFRRFCARSPHLLHQVPHKYIASYLGIDPTNFSKLYNTVRI